MPINQPLNAIKLSVAGAAQIRIKKYSRANIETCGEHGIIARTAVTNNHCNAQIIAAPIKAIVML